MLSGWKEEFKNDRDVVARIEKYQESYRYAMEIDEFLETTEISLDELRRDVPGFVASQMYIFGWNTVAKILRRHFRNNGKQNCK